MIGQDTDLTKKAVKTREHIVTTALHLFATKGYQETTLRDIASEAQCSLGLTYRYFTQKEELILELYRHLASEFEEEVQALPRGPMATRLAQALRADLARLAPHRSALSALFGAGLAPDSEVALLGDRVAPIRETVWKTCLSIVMGSSDAPREPQCRDLATLFYSTHLLLVLFWLQDRSPEQRSTFELLTYIRNMIGLLRPVLAVRPVGKSVARLARILSPMFGPPFGDGGTPG